MIPLLLSWMLVACALLLVLDEVPASFTSNHLKQALAQNKWGLLMLAWFVASALHVPEVIDRALTAGVLAAMVCIWIEIGRAHV